MSMTVGQKRNLARGQANGTLGAMATARLRAWRARLVRARLERQPARRAVDHGVKHPSRLIAGSDREGRREGGATEEARAQLYRAKNLA